MSKLTSGRFIWCVASAIVFSIMSINGSLSKEDVIKIIIVVVMSYFSRSDRKKENV